MNELTHQFFVVVHTVATVFHIVTIVTRLFTQQSLTLCTVRTKDYKKILTQTKPIFPGINAKELINACLTTPQHKIKSAIWVYANISDTIVL